jgi:hypothetical protein
MPRLLDPYDPLLAGSMDATATVPHDKAIARAMENVEAYHPVVYPVNEEGDSSTSEDDVDDFGRRRRTSSNPKRITKHARKTLIVARLSPKTTETKLVEVRSFDFLFFMHFCLG